MVDKFIYLAPGNWFELRNINKDKSHPFDLQCLKKEIINQVNNHADKLSFINISFGKKYNNCNVEEIVMDLIRFLPPDEKRMKKASSRKLYWDHSKKLYCLK